MRLLTGPTPATPPNPDCWMALAARPLVPAHDRNLPLADHKSPLRGPMSWIGRPDCSFKRNPSFYSILLRTPPPNRLSARPYRFSAFVLSAFESCARVAQEKLHLEASGGDPRLRIDQTSEGKAFEFGAPSQPSTALSIFIRLRKRL